ncbi:helix-turn-helix transcriptional regulator [Pelagibius litoralis]|uniref:Helix-turn-helix transcriptional regulator n=1 Tax=Pelagibius litoralis TaxID=374515 RepID=A0A967C624_9PROT|nr:helix-turn-helix transcriptional regulator [Pelagibius litoralis]NIA68126.1 helix-turn-helix transcriptional regulator [Pelagibius litoralis]
MAETTLITDSPALNHSAPGGYPSPPEPARITGLQCRAARAMLQWSREDLAERSGVHYITLCNFELGHCALKPATARLLRLVFVSAGLLFIDADASGGAGLCLAKPEA